MKKPAPASLSAQYDRDGFVLIPDLLSAKECDSLKAEARKVQGPGLPDGLDPRDPRWTSDDCIEPPGS